MSVIDLDRLLQEISPEAPSGENDLEHDPAFMELERDMQGTPAVEVESKIVQEAREPDWGQVRKSALELLERTHDLRLVVSLTRALLHTEGIQGFHDGLSLIHGFVDRYWDSLYPRLDPDDDNDPMERVNALETLNDWHAIIAPLMKVTLCASRSAGKVNLRQYRIAGGRLDGLTVTEEERNTAPSSATIEGIFAECDPVELRAAWEAAGGAAQKLAALDALLREKIDGALAPDFKQLGQVLKEMHGLLESGLAKREPLNIAENAQVAQTADPEPSEASRAAPGDAVGGVSGGRRPDVVENRQDVLRLLEKICDYYAGHEPSSPVPLLLRRAMGLVDKNFLEIMQDLAPDCISQVEAIAKSRES